VGGPQMGGGVKEGTPDPTLSSLSQKSRILHRWCECPRGLMKPEDGPFSVTVMDITRVVGSASRSMAARAGGWECKCIPLHVLGFLMFFIAFFAFLSFWTFLEKLFALFFLNYIKPSPAGSGATVEPPTSTFCGPLSWRVCALTALVAQDPFGHRPQDTVGGKYPPPPTNPGKLAAANSARTEMEIKFPRRELGLAK